jgi:16S rRNA (cytosine1402-N4)-methyltransferase
MTGTLPEAAADSPHIPVLAAEAVAALAVSNGGLYLDGTFGAGGYSRLILAEGGRVLALDRDPSAISAGAALVEASGGRLMLAQTRFSRMEEAARERGLGDFDGIVLDIGVSSMQIDQPERGFSFRFDGPLDMRMDNADSTGGPSAADAVNTLDERELADILYQLGEERLSRRIARAIVAARAQAPITTTLRLAEVIRAVVPKDGSGIDPATRSFQALRIHVNDELGEIDRALKQAVQLLSPAGRLVVVCFHSLEDRIVKRFMLEASGRTPAPSRHDPRGLATRQSPRFRLLTPKTLRPTATESRENPRACSARLRAIECVAADGGAA